MSIRFEKAFELMKVRGLTTTRIRKEKIISEWTLQSMRNGKSITTDSVGALCAVLDCQPGDILYYEKDK